MRRRLAAIAAFLAPALLAVGTGPARAGEGPTGRITSPAQNAVVTRPNPTIAGEFHPAEGALGTGTVDQVTVTVERLGHPDQRVDETFPGRDDGEPVRFTWTTPPLPFNGAYRATAVGRGTEVLDTDGPDTTVVRRDFSLEAPPAVPSGVAASVDRGIVTVTWKPNTEPDLLGYQVQRAADGSNEWVNLGQPTTETTFSDASVPEPGEWRYRVVAARLGRDDQHFVASGPSVPASAVVPRPPPPTTAPAGGDGGGGGGSAPSGSPGAGGGAAPSGGSGGSGSATPSGSTPATARSGRSDMSSFGALLDANRRRAAAGRPSAPDPGFSESLPFQGRPDIPEPGEEPGEEDQEVGADEPQLEVGERAVADDDADRRTSLSFLAGGLLAFVMLMQVLWIKGEVDRAGDLPAEPPAPPPAGPPHRSPSPPTPAVRSGDGAVTVAQGRGRGQLPVRGARPS
jgi:hypothetical protein